MNFFNSGSPWKMPSMDFYMFACNGTNSLPIPMISSRSYWKLSSYA